MNININITTEDADYIKEKREQAGLSRNEVSIRSKGIIKETRLRDMEDGKTKITAEDFVRLSELYKNTEMCPYYCANFCKIGEKLHRHEVESMDLTRISLEILDSLKILEADKDNLISITKDGKITDFERETFDHIFTNLDEMSKIIDSLKCWAASLK